MYFFFLFFLLCMSAHSWKAMTAGTTLLETGAVIGLPRTVLAKHADDTVLRSLRIGRDINPAAAHAVRELLVSTPEV